LLVAGQTDSYIHKVGGLPSHILPFSTQPLRHSSAVIDSSVRTYTVMHPIKDSDSAGSGEEIRQNTVEGEETAPTQQPYSS
jgi:hypothetical protein